MRCCWSHRDGLRPDAPESSALAEVAPTDGHGSLNGLAESHLVHMSFAYPAGLRQGHQGRQVRPGMRSGVSLLLTPLRRSELKKSLLNESLRGAKDPQRLLLLS